MGEMARNVFQKVVHQKLQEQFNLIGQHSFVRHVKKSKFIIDICACWGKRGHPVGFKRIDCCFCCSPPFSKETIEIKKGFGNLSRLDNDAWLWLTFFEEVVYPYSQGGGGGGGNGGGGGGGGG